MKKILIDGRCLNEVSTGGKNYAIELIKSYQREYGKDNVFVLCRQSQETKWFNEIIYPLKTYSFINFFLLHRIIRKVHPNIFHSPFHYSSFFKVKGCLYVTSVLDLMYRTVPNFYRKNSFLNLLGVLKTNFFIKRSLNNSDIVISISETTADDVKRYFDKDSFVIPCGVILRNYTDLSCQSGLSIYPKNSIFLYVGLTTVHKNVEFLISCFEKAVTDKMLIICGKNDGNLKSSNPRVKFLGFVSEDDLGYLYNNCSAFVFPSLYEGFGLPILEALAQGSIVFSSTGGSLKEFSDKLIHFFNPRDADSLIRLLEGVNNIQAPDKNEVAEYLSLFRWNVNFRKMHRIISLYEKNSNLCMYGDIQRS